jgi:hypothetical protein
MLLPVGFLSQKLEHKVTNTQTFINQRLLRRYLPVIFEVPF